LINNPPLLFLKRWVDSQQALSLPQKGKIVVSVPLILSVLFVLLLYLLLEWSVYETKQEIRLSDAFQLSAELARNNIDAVQLLATYALNRKPELAQRFRGLAEAAPGLQKGLRDLMKVDPQALPIIERIDVTETRLINLLKLDFDSADAGDVDAINLGYFNEHLKSCLEQLDSDLRMLNQETTTKHRSALSESDAVLDLVRFALALGVLALVSVSLSLSAFFTRGIVSRIAIARDNAERFMNNKPLNQVLQGSDEIAELDQTFRKMAAAIEESNRKERAMIEHAADVICSVGRDRKFSAVSKAAAKVWQYTAEELLGTDVLSVVENTDLESSQQHFAEAFDRAEGFSFENRIRRKDGSTMDSLWSVFWSQVDQTLFCVAHDITARKQAEKLIQENEQRVRLIMDAVPLGLVVIDKNGGIEYLNRTLEKMTGFSDEQIRGTNILEWWRQGNPKESASQLLKALLDSPGKVFEANVQGRSGAIFPAELSLSHFTIRDQSKLLLGILDVTAKNEIERVKREFLAMVTHDLRTPLTNLQGTINLLQAGALAQLSERGGDIVDKADREIARMIRLIGDLVSLKNTGQFELSLGASSLTELLSASIDAVRSLAERRQIKIIDQTEDTYLHCDGGRIIQVLVNLLSNAVKFSPDQGQIRIWSSAVADQVKISVSDQGRGLLEQDKAFIFEKFSQAKKEDSATGTGLGLPICKAIVEQHGGTIGVESGAGSGCTFWFTIPKAQQPDGIWSV